jgi:diguanylate cyclase (GGDEF)-like protein
MLLSQGKVRGMVMEFKKVNGENFWGLANVLPVRFFEEDCLLVGLMDISSQREIEERLEATNEQMEEAVMRANELAILAESRADENLRRAEQMTTLYKIGLSLTQGLDLNQTLMELYEQSRSVVHADTFYVALLDEAGEKVSFPIFVDNGKYVKMEAVNIFSTRNLTREVIESRSILYLNDRTDPDTQAKHPSMQLGEHTTRTYVGLPLVLHDLVIGVISVQSLQPNAFSEDEIMLLETMATQAAIAIANARLFDETQRLAITDSLTGLFTRRHMFELARKEYARARRYRHPFAVVFLDIDHFKHVNDAFGHAAGDTVLNAVAQICLDNVRQMDILGRFGGEEIMLLLPDTSLENSIVVANRLRQRIASTPVQTEQGPVSVTVSIGVAALDDTCDRLETLIEHSDQAMYSAKRQGRNRVITWQPSL